ncbi:MAG: hypothetical protein LBT63_00610, partial [Holosporaceae bacterium]|nr:hypothetical protein [Holosporaceae bacterium]
LNWNQQAISQAKKSLDRMYGALRLAGDEKPPDAEEDDEVLEALCSNLNTPLALHCLRKIADEIYKTTDPHIIRNLCGKLRRGAELLGLLERNCEDWFRTNMEEEISESEIENLMEARRLAKDERKFQLADEIRAKLLEKNIRIEDTKDGSVWSRK